MASNALVRVDGGCFLFKCAVALFWSIAIISSTTTTVTATATDPSSVIELAAAAATTTNNNSNPPHALLVAIPLPGHLNPLIAIGEELISRGWKVTVASTSDAKHHVSRQALPSVSFLDIGICAGVIEEDVINRATNSDDFLSGAVEIFLWSTSLHPCMYRQLLAKLQSSDSDPSSSPSLPTIIIGDFASSAAFDVADTLNIPWVVNNADLVSMISPTIVPIAEYAPGLLSTNSQFDLTSPSNYYGLIPRTIGLALRGATSILMYFLQYLFNYNRAQLGLQPMQIYERLSGRVILVNGAFPLEYPRQIPPLVAMTGAMIPRSQQVHPHLRLDKHETEYIEMDDRPVVFVSMGTLAPLRRDQVAVLLEGFERVPQVRFLWKLSKKAQEHLPEPSHIPPNVKISTWVSSQFGILSHPQVRLFLSHCGMNSAYESLFYNTSLLCLPMFMDQNDMAIRVVDSGAGLKLEKNHMSAEIIAAKISSILNDTSFAFNTLRLSKAIKQAGGVVKAADIIEHVNEYGSQHWATSDTYYPWYARAGIDAALLLMLALTPAIYSCMLCARWIKRRCCCCSRSHNTNNINNNNNHHHNNHNNVNYKPAAKIL